MFTGLIQEIGYIQHIKSINNGKRMTIQTKQIGANTKIGDSIAVNGVCSTVTQKTDRTIIVDYMPETLNKTTLKGSRSGDFVNLEPCLTLQDKLGGHLVTGHIDTIGTLTDITEEDTWQTMTITFPEEFSTLIIPKGSITLDGISLTLSNLTDTSLSVSLIPHTLTHTTLHKRMIGDMLNIEFDIVGKYIQRYQSKQTGDSHD